MGDGWFDGWGGMQFDCHLVRQYTLTDDVAYFKSNKRVY